MRLRVLVLASFVVGSVVACGPAPEPTPPPPPVAPPPPPPPPVVVVAEDPAVVRCGVDEPPRTGGVDGEAPASRAKRAPPQDPAPPPPPAGAMPPSTPMPTVRLPGRPPRRPMPLPAQTIKAGALTSSGEPPASPDTLAQATASLPDYEACRGLLGGGDVGSHDLDLELSSSGAPLRVRIRDARITPFARCLAEQTCRAHGAPGTSSSVRVPVVVAAPPPPAPPEPPLLVDVVLEGDRAPTSAVSMELRKELTAQTKACVRASRVMPHAQIVLAVTVVKVAPPSATAPGIRFDDLRVEGQPRGVDADAIGCLLSGFASATIPTTGPAPRITRVVLTLQPLARSPSPVLSGRRYREEALSRSALRRRGPATTSR